VSFADAVLTVVALARSPRRGYPVHRALRSLLAGVRTVNHGQVYATLERLTREGLLVRTLDRRGRATFAATEAGRRRLDRGRARPARTTPPADELPVRLAVLALANDGAGVAGLVAEQRRRCDALERVAATRPRDLVREAALRHLAAERAWLALVETSVARCGERIFD